MRLDGTTAPGLPLPALAVVVPARAEITSASAATEMTAKRFRLLPSSSDPDQVTLSRSLPMEVPSLPIVGVPFAVCAAWPQFMSLNSRLVMPARGLGKSQVTCGPLSSRPLEGGTAGPQTGGFPVGGKKTPSGTLGL